MENRFLQSNYIENLDGIIQHRQITADTSLNYGFNYSGANADLRFNNIPMQKGFLKEAKVMAKIQLVDSNGVPIDLETNQTSFGGGVITDWNLSLADSTKCLVNRTEVMFNGVPVISESQL